MNTTSRSRKTYGATALVAPHLSEGMFPRPITLISGGLDKAQRFLPVAK